MKVTIHGVISHSLQEIIVEGDMADDETSMEFLEREGHGVWLSGVKFLAPKQKSLKGRLFLPWNTITWIRDKEEPNG